MALTYIAFALAAASSVCVLAFAGLAMPDIERQLDDLDMRVSLLRAILRVKREDECARCMRTNSDPSTPSDEEEPL